MYIYSAFLHHLAKITQIPIMQPRKLYIIHKPFTIMMMMPPALQNRPQPPSPHVTLPPFSHHHHYPPSQCHWLVRRHDVTQQPFEKFFRHCLESLEHALTSGQLSCVIRGCLSAHSYFSHKLLRSAFMGT